jgi:hypothetical protein
MMAGIAMAMARDYRKFTGVLVSFPALAIGWQGLL